MALSEAIAALTARWATLVEQLDGAARARLDELVEESATAANDEARIGVARRIVEHVVLSLPAHNEIRRAVDNARTAPRLAGTASTWQHELARVAALARPAGTRRQTSVDARLLGARSVSRVNIRRGGGDPDQEGLIRLRGKDGRVSLPQFQFTRDGEPRSLVLRINRLLGADLDPWGVADWWLCPNVWLAGTPADLLDQLEDSALVAAATAAVEG